MRKKFDIDRKGLDYVITVTESDWTEADAVRAFMFSALSSLGRFSRTWFRQHKESPFQTVAAMAEFLEHEQREHPAASPDGKHPAYRYRSFSIIRIDSRVRVSYRSHSYGNPHTDTVLTNELPLKLTISGERLSSVKRRANAATKQVPPPSLVKKLEHSTLSS